MNDPEIYIVDGLNVRAESDRHAAKYYRRVLNRDPDAVTQNGKTRELFSFCENTGLGIFCDDESEVHYKAWSDGPYTLTGPERTRMASLTI